MAAGAQVLAVAADATHRFSKPPVPQIRLIEGMGVEGDAHCGITVRHRSRVAIDPTRPNLRQVHLIHAELLGDLRARGFAVEPGDLGENITTGALDILALPRGTILYIGGQAAVRLTGLRNPCAQIDRFRPGLLAAVLDRAPGGAIIRKAGVMATVDRGGTVRPGDAIAVALPPPPHLPLEPV